jgi:hypothetical protein
MIRLIKLIFYVASLLVVYFSGVKYSGETKEIANWLFEAKEKEIELNKIHQDIKNNPEDIINEDIEINPNPEEPIKDKLEVETNTAPQNKEVEKPTINE